MGRGWDPGRERPHPAKGLSQTGGSLLSGRGSPLVGNQCLLQGHLTQTRNQGMKLTIANIYLPDIVPPFTR